MNTWARGGGGRGGGGGGAGRVGGGGGGMSRPSVGGGGMSATFAGHGRKRAAFARATSFNSFSPQHEPRLIAAARDPPRVASPSFGGGSPGFGGGISGGARPGAQFRLWRRQPRLWRRSVPDFGGGSPGFGGIGGARPGSGPWWPAEHRFRSQQLLKPARRRWRWRGAIFRARCRQSFVACRCAGQRFPGAGNRVPGASDSDRARCLAGGDRLPGAGDRLPGLRG